ncbi:Uncharacterized protein SCF082_LOCUS39536 [Durusdinium trenchii]|uniref:Endonuclease/exonuclease/phosphatase domain-containing protein n=1 Tax=Durusdinium trenchii TaxID=1381693 RepID=A0ABP0Q5E6_9DINO
MDSKAAFAERAKAVGVSETHVAPLSGKQLDTFGAFAFISSFQPGGTDETPFVRALGAALQVNPTAFTEAELSSFRRLYYEAHTLAMGDLRSRLERKDGEAPRKIPMAERSQLLDLLKQELPGITIDLQLEPAHKLVDMVKQQVEDNCIRFLPLKECLSRASELLNHKHESALEFSVQDKIISGWFALLTKEPASGYRAVTLQQLVQADQELWLHAAQEVRGKNLLATPKPLDQALTQLQQSAEIRYHLLPLPASQKEPKDPPRKRLKQDSKGDKGGKKGLGKGSELEFAFNTIEIDAIDRTQTSVIVVCMCAGSRDAMVSIPSADVTSRDKPGRRQAQPLGMSNLTPQDQARVHSANQLYAFTALAVLILSLRNAMVSVENPRALVERSIPTKHGLRALPPIVSEYAVVTDQRPHSLPFKQLSKLPSFVENGESRAEGKRAKVSNPRKTEIRLSQADPKELYGVFREPEVFVDAALTAKHPIDYAFPLPDALLEAVAKLISDGPKLTIARRKLALKKVQVRADRLRAQELELHASLDPRIAKVVEGKNLLLWKEFLEETSFDDPNLFDEFCKGFKASHGWFHRLEYPSKCPPKLAINHKSKCGDANLPAHQQGLKVLGLPVGSVEYIPVGSIEYIQAELRQLQAKQQPLLEVLPDIPDLQTSWLLLLYCPSPRVHYALRGICPDLTKHFATERDNAVHTCLRRLLQQPNELPRPAIDTAAAHWASWQDPTPILRQKMPQVFDTIQQQIENPELPSLQCLQHVGNGKPQHLSSLDPEANTQQQLCTTPDEQKNARTRSGRDPGDVVTYNLYWWCVSDETGRCPQYAGGKGFAQIYARLQQNGPFDLIGFQECDNVGQIVAGTSLTPNFKYFTPPAGNDAPMAWNGEKFTAIEGPGVVWVARDKYGDRHVNWVRLQVVGSSETILFANTHGPLDQCGGKPGGTVATNYINAVNQHKKTKDVVIFTGDFNCGSNQDTIKQLSEAYQLDATDTSYNGADHIFSSSGFSVLWKGASDGSPSDHQLLKAVLQSGSHSRCPVPPDNGGCCLTCRFNHYCPSNKGCYASGQSGCSGGYCPAPPEENWLHSAVEIVV